MRTLPHSNAEAQKKLEFVARFCPLPKPKKCIESQGDMPHKHFSAHVSVPCLSSFACDDFPFFEKLPIVFVCRTSTTSYVGWQGKQHNTSSFRFLEELWRF